MELLFIRAATYSQLELYFIRAGTYSQLELKFIRAGTYRQLELYFIRAGTYRVETYSLSGKESKQISGLEPILICYLIFLNRFLLRRPKPKVPNGA